MEVDEDGSARRKIKPKIVMLKNCCGLMKNQEYFLEAYTRGGLHYKVEGRKEFVEEKRQGVHWEWVDECEVPAYDPSVEGDKPKPHKRKQRSEDEPFKNLEARLRLGARLERIERRLPGEYKSLMTKVSEYELVVSRLEDLEEAGSQEESRSTSSSDRRGSADLCGPQEACREEAHSKLKSIARSPNLTFHKRESELFTRVQLPF